MGRECGRGTARGTAAEGTGVGMVDMGTKGAGMKDVGSRADSAVGWTCKAEGEELVVTDCCTVGEASIVVRGQEVQV